MLHLIYRSYGPENKKGRPSYYSKLSSLKSFVHAARALASAQVNVVFLNDGRIPKERLDIMERSGEVLAHDRLGLRGSMRAALALPLQRGWDRADLVWLAEDDYLYLPSALSTLVAAAETFTDASYFGLYASIGCRQPNGLPCGPTIRIPPAWADSEPTPIRGHVWRRALSTTSTFGARVGALVDDRRLMAIAMLSGGAWDHTTCLLYQGFLPFDLTTLRASFCDGVKPAQLPRRIGLLAARVGLNAFQCSRILAGRPRRILMAADPSPVTHLESAMLAAGTDWKSVAASTQSMRL